jgi:hypothetical protein
MMNVVDSGDGDDDVDSGDDDDEQLLLIWR